MIKRIVALLLVTVMLLSFAACGNTNAQPDATTNIQNETTTDTDTQDFMGEWKILRYRYDTNGRKQYAYVATLELSEDGRASFEDAAGTWKYMESKNVINVRIPGNSMRLKKVEVEGFVGLEMEAFTDTEPESQLPIDVELPENVTLPENVELPEETEPAEDTQEDYHERIFFREVSDRHTKACEFITGDWIYDDGCVVSFGADGAVVDCGLQQGIKWKVVCVGPYNVLYYGEYEQSLFTENAGCLESLTRYDGHLHDNMPYTTLYPSARSTQITTENWRDHFGEQISDLAEITTKSEEKTDSWGENYTEITYYVTFKNPQDFAKGTHLNIQWTFEDEIYTTSVSHEPLAINMDHIEGQILNMNGMLVKNP